MPGTHGIDHVTITTRDCREAKRFYALALRPLGFSVVLDWPEGGRAYLGRDAESSSLWLVQGRNPSRVALSFSGDGRSDVDAFYAAALAAGGLSHSHPALRPEYTASTYAAEVIDPEGNSLEVICWNAESLALPAEHAA